MAETPLPTELIESSFISAEDFNQIVDIYDQDQIDHDTLTAIAKIFESHEVTNKFGLQLLHRHYQMPEGSIAVTSSIGDSIAVTKITPVGNIDPAAIRGQLYLLNSKGKFQAYEYEHGKPISFPSGFLADMASFIQQHSLQSKVALISDVPPPYSTYEVLIGSNATATVAGNVWKGGQDSLQTVGWKFTEHPTPDTPEAFISIHFYWKCTTKKQRMPFNLDTQDVKAYLKKEGCIWEAMM